MADIVLKKYNDIIREQRPVPLQPRMPRLNRAKLFHPYDALKGFEETVHAKENLPVKTADSIRIEE